MPKLQMSPPWLAGITSHRDAEYIDAVQPGLVLRIRRGRMVWFVRYLFDGSARRYRIGEHPAVGLSAARKLASVVRGRVAAGDDPQAEKRAKREAVRRRRMGETLSGALASWLKDEKLGPLGRWKDGLEGGSAQASLWHLRRLQRMFGKKLLSDLTPKDIESALLAKHAPATRNRGLCAFRGLFGWAVRQGLLDKDPTAGMPKEHETARTRVLSDEEIRTLINGFDQTRYGRALRLLFLTALRRDEVLGLKWSWIDLERGVLTIPPSVEKTGRVRDELRRTGLPPQAVALLAEQRSALFAEGIRSEYVFATSTGERPHPDSLKPILYRLRGRRSNGWPPSKDKRAKQRNAVLPDDVNIHDIRRPVADGLLNRIGAQPWIVDHVVLGHARPKLLRTYMPTLPLGEAQRRFNGGEMSWNESFARAAASKAAITSPVWTQNRPEPERGRPLISRCPEVQDHHARGLVSATYVEQRDGAYMISGTRVSLDSIVYAFLGGQSAETIAQAFPVLTLEQVYGAIAFYLAHRDEVDRYLEAQRQDFEAKRAEARAADPMFYQKLADARKRTPLAR